MPINITNDEDMKDKIFKNINWNFNGISVLVRNFSEQAAIDFVNFLIDVMIKLQQFSNAIPTVGGEIHIALISKTQGFKWISKEEYKFKDHAVPKGSKSYDN